MENLEVEEISLKEEENKTENSLKANSEDKKVVINGIEYDLNYVRLCTLKGKTPALIQEDMLESSSTYAKYLSLKSTVLLALNKAKNKMSEFYKDKMDTLPEEMKSRKVLSMDKIKLQIEIMHREEYLVLKKDLDNFFDIYNELVEFLDAYKLKVNMLQSLGAMVRQEMVSETGGTGNWTVDNIK